MKAPLNLQETKISKLKPAKRLHFKLAIGLGCVCLGVGLLLPAIKAGFWHPQRVPSGQFQADMRTMVAEVRYLFTPETDFEKASAQSTERPVTFEQRLPAVTLTNACAQI
jgi:hypothetical protein